VQHVDHHIVLSTSVLHRTSMSLPVPSRSQNYYSCSCLAPLAVTPILVPHFSSAPVPSRSCLSRCRPGPTQPRALFLVWVPVNVITVCSGILVIMDCRPTNYELLRWLVETPSRDFEHYQMSGGSLTCYRIFITCQTTSWHVEKYQEVVWHVINILRCFCLRFFCDVFVFFHVTLSIFIKYSFIS